MPWSFREVLKLLRNVTVSNSNQMRALHAPDFAIALDKRPCYDD